MYSEIEISSIGKGGLKIEELMLEIEKNKKFRTCGIWIDFEERMGII